MIWLIAGGSILFIIALMIIGPFISIWAINLLFNLSIPITFDTWLAMFWLQLLLASKSGSTKK